MKIIIVIEDTFGNPKCKFEHGLSVYIETEKHKLLVDTGATNAFIENADKLGIDIKQIDTVILSHGHYDHSGGIIAFNKLNHDAKIYIQKSACDDYYHGDKYIGIDKRIVDINQVCILDGDCRIDEELFLFTNITGRRYFAKSNLDLSKKVEGKHMQDDFSHEQCLVISENSKNVLISGCAHNGILNIIDKYREYFNNDPEIVISGFHMTKKTEYTKDETEIILLTAKELSEMKTVFYTGHCTGEKAIELMAPVMKEKLVQIHSGYVIS